MRAIRQPRVAVQVRRYWKSGEIKQFSKDYLLTFSARQASWRQSQHGSKFVAGGVKLHVQKREPGDTAESSTLSEYTTVWMSPQECAQLAEEDSVVMQRYDWIDGRPTQRLLKHLKIEFDEERSQYLLSGLVVQRAHKDDEYVDRVAVMIEKEHVMLLRQIIRSALPYWAGFLPTPGAESTGHSRSYSRYSTTTDAANTNTVEPPASRAVDVE
ncbi:MAG: hypothetical protein MHM6MM_005221 [Cercozoa sp. M6MM]